MQGPDITCAHSY